MKNFPGYIVWLKSVETGRDFPIVIFSADVDFVTTGMVSLTSLEHNEVVVTFATAEELIDIFERNQVSLIEGRMQRELGRDDLRYSLALKTEQVDSSRHETTYSDIYKREGEATDTGKRQSIEEFVVAGGVVIDHHFGIREREEMSKNGGGLWRRLKRWISA